MLGDLFTQFQRDRKLKQWNKMIHAGTQFAFADGPERYLIPVTDDDLGSQLFIYGEAEFSKVSVAMGLLERSHVGRFVDVGANVGHIVIPGLKRGLFELGVAIEPDLTNFGCLAINAQMNGVTERIQLVHAAAGNGEASKLKLALASSEFGDHRIAVGPELAKTRRVVEVLATTIDEVASGLDRTADLVWMDIQGYEVTALRGAEDARAARVPIVIEFWPEGILATGECLMNLLSLLSEYREFADLSLSSAHFKRLEDLPKLWASLLSGQRGRGYVDILLK